MNALTELMRLLFDLYLTIVIFRVWFQLARADFYSPLCQLSLKTTDFYVKPVGFILPPIGNFNLAAASLAIIVAIGSQAALLLGNFHVLDVFKVAILHLIDKSFSIVLFVLFITAILSWFPQARHHPAAMLLNQLIEPIVGMIRRVVPPVSGIDFSVMIAMISIYFLNRLTLELLAPFMLPGH